MSDPKPVLGRPNFTLIELLVVVAIIAILAALLMPALSRARAKAQEIACINNIRQIAMAVGMYSDEHDGYWTYCENKAPPSGSFPPSSGSKGPHYLLWPYANDTESWVCPADPDPKEFTWHFWGTDDGSVQQRARGCSYMFSEHAVYSIGYQDGQAMRAADIKSPLTFGYVADGDANINGWKWKNLWGPDADGARLNHTHINGINFLYGDMHVAKHEYISVVNEPWMYIRSDPLDENGN